MQIGKGTMKLSLFVDDMILYTENPKQFTKILLVLIKVTGYKINIRKPNVFRYNSNEHSKVTKWNGRVSLAPSAPPLLLSHPSRVGLLDSLPSLHLKNDVTGLIIHEMVKICSLIIWVKILQSHLLKS